jgi:hypothetical protein
MIFINQIIHQNEFINQSPVPSYIQLCQLFEQTMFRFAQCTWPQNMLNTLKMQSFHQYFVLKWLKHIPVVHFY